MRLRRLVRSLLPSGVVDYYQARRAGLRLGPTWQGVYRTFADVPGGVKPFDVPSLTEHTRTRTAQALQEARAGSGPSAEVVGEHNLLPLLVSSVLSRRGTARVVDFGGGMGIGFAHLLGTVSRADQVDYHVVERPDMCEGGRTLFAGDARITFHTAVPSGLGPVDIVYVCTALQYVDDYAALLSQLAGLGAEYLLFAHLSAGAIPTYVTVQRNMAGSEVPYRFFSADELRSTLDTLGYLPLFRGWVDRQYEQDNFPPGHRMGRPVNMLFGRRGG